MGTQSSLQQSRALDASGMSRLGKLAFAHRKLWERDPTYRAAFLLGPPPVLGMLIGAAVWAALNARQPPDASGWAVPSRTTDATDKPRMEAPLARLPAAGANGDLAGFTTGWLAGIHQAEVSPTLTVNLHSDTLSSYKVDVPEIDMARIIQEAPKTGLYIGVEEAALAVRVAGRTSIALRTDHEGGSTVDCLMRFSLNGHRIVSDYEGDLNPYTSRMPDPVDFDLQPGLYRIGVAFGCWRGREMAGPAKLSLMIRHPGEAALHPARMEDVVRPVMAETRQR